MNRRWLMGPLLDEAPVIEAPGGAGLPPAEAPVEKQPQAAGVDEVAQLKGRLAQMEQRLQQQPAPQVQQPQAPQVDLQKEFWKNPIGVIAQASQIARMQGANDVMQVVAPTMERSAKDTARSADPELFDHLEPYINAKMGEVPEQYRVNATVWTNAFNSVKGEKMKDVMAFKGQKGAAGGQDGPLGASQRQAQPARKVDLTPEEKAFARKFKLSEESYQHGKELWANQDKAWEQVITFDSDRPLPKRPVGEVRK